MLGEVADGNTCRNSDFVTTNPFQHIAHRGSCGKTGGVLQNLRPEPLPAEMPDIER
jgi:hypothetical protein